MNAVIRKVHVVFKTHLDLGYTNLAEEIAKGYFEDFIPRSIELSRTLRAEGAPERFVWTTGSWLVHEYLERATPERRAVLEQAIADGDIAWHALPATTHSELMDPSLFAHGISLSQELDRRYSRTTTAAKMTDVPGHTIGIVPLLVQAGVRFLHFGVNPASTPPDVPDAFLWRAADGSEIAVTYSRYDYGSAITLPGLDEALIVEHTGDNHGPPPIESVRETFARARKEFPDAEVVGSTLDAFGVALERVRDQLPVVTKEVADSWIQGVGSDPLKVARFRELSRLRNEWLARGAVDADDPSFRRASTELLLVAERTWGVAQSIHLRDYERYSAEQFRAVRSTPKFAFVERSWTEQRDYLDRAVEALPPTLKAEANERLQLVEPREEPFQGTVSDPLTHVKAGKFELSFDPATGAVSHLADKASGRAWASAEKPLARLGYQTFSQEDYDRFWTSYIRSRPEVDHWAREDFTKPGIASEGAESRWWDPRLEDFQISESPDRTSIRSRLAFPAEASDRFGAPRRCVLDVHVPAEGDSIEIVLQWFDKTACRLPEAIWLSFTAVAPNPVGWTFDKLGQKISPLDVVHHGNRELHAVGSGVRYADAEGSFELETLDAPLVAPGDPALLHFGEGQPDTTHGVHVNLYNNVWGNNFTTWYDDDGKFRFRLTAR